MSERVLHSIGLGGGCHWCTEAVFLSLLGVKEVAQGFIASTGEYDQFAEGVIVRYDPDKINLTDLIRIHLMTHESTSDHSMRAKYRSAVYSFSTEQFHRADMILRGLQTTTDRTLVTRVYDFRDFKPTAGKYANYYYENPDKPFCKVHIQPKLISVLKQFPDHVIGLKFKEKGS